MRERPAQQLTRLASAGNGTSILTGFDGYDRADVEVPMLAAVFFGTVILGEMLDAVQLSGIAVVLVALVCASKKMATR